MIIWQFLQAPPLAGASLQSRLVTFGRWLDQAANYDRAVIRLLLAGLLMRIGWAIGGHHFTPIISEMYEIAQGYARTGVISDAYHLGSGPTAHAAPAWPVLVGTVYQIFGLHSSLSEYVLTVISLALVGLSVVLFDRVAARLGTPAWARLGAVAFVALVPLNLEIEVQLLRVWEQAAAAAIMSFYLWLMLRLDARPQRLSGFELPCSPPSSHRLRCYRPRPHSVHTAALAC